MRMRLLGGYTCQSDRQFDVLFRREKRHQVTRPLLPYETHHRTAVGRHRRVGKIQQALAAYPYATGTKADQTPKQLIKWIFRCRWRR